MTLMEYEEAARIVAAVATDTHGPVAPERVMTAICVVLTTNAIAFQDLAATARKITHEPR